MTTVGETDGPAAPVTQANNTNTVKDQNAPLIIIQQVPASGGQYAQGGYAQGAYAQGYGQPYGQGPVYDDPSNVWCFLIFGLFFPIICCFGLCCTDPNVGPRTRNAYNTLKWVTIVYWTIYFIIVCIWAANS